MNQPAKEIALDTPLGRMTGLHWPQPGAPRVLCLHGWLDNAASFVPLADHLEALDLVALDLPGHGHSQHRHPTARYHFVDYLWDVNAALEALGWQQFHLVGHSMGGAVCSLYTAAAGHSVTSLVVLDGLGPVTCAAENTAARLQKSLRRMRSDRGTLKAYASIEEMALTRQRVAPISLEAATLLCERSARQVDGHYEWRTDPELNWVSPVLLTEEQVLNCLAAIESPVLSFIAPGMKEWAGKLEDRQTAVNDGRHHPVDGDHHFHMDQAAEIAPEILAFILEATKRASG